MNEIKEYPAEETLEFEHEGEIYDNENPMPPADLRWVRGPQPRTTPYNVVNSIIFLGKVVVGVALLLIFGLLLG